MYLQPSLRLIVGINVHRDHMPSVRARHNLLKSSDINSRCLLSGVVSLGARWGSVCIPWSTLDEIKQTYKTLSMDVCGYIGP